MTGFARLLPSALLGLALFSAPLSAQPATFADKALGEEAQRYETALKAAIKTGKKAPRELRQDAEKYLATPGADPKLVVPLFQQAAVLDGADADNWNGLAQALLAVAADPKWMSPSEQGTRAAAAAYRGYEKSRTAVQRGFALALLGEAQKRRTQWRAAITAYSQSLIHVDNPKVRAAYDLVRAEHGFRITETKTDSDAGAPRACILFSERLATGQVDWPQYVKVDGREPQAVTAETRQLCVDGLAHGRGYTVSLRQGLPSAIGETLLKTADLQVYVRDRGPSVRSAGRAYVLPATGQQGIPLTTVNIDALGLEVYRIGDRSLAHVLQSGDFQRQVSRYDIDAIKERTGQKVYEGEMTVARRHNEEVTTAFPVSEALKSLQPGVYVLAAHVLPKKEREDSRGYATQWFIVSDLGLTAFTGSDGMHAFVRSLASAAPIGNTEVRLVARNNEVLATARTDARGYVRFDAGLGRGEGGLAPAMLSATTAAGDYAFLDMTAAAFDLSDRGVKGRDAPGPIDAFAYADRGVYRPGETAHLSVLVRDRNAIAAMVPVTMIVSRPDGVEHRRVALADMGLGGRVHGLALSGNAMSGTWRVKVYTDPKASPIAQTAFLVEDFVPERLDLKLEPGTAVLTPEAGGTVKLAGRYLYGPPAAGLAIEGDIVVKPAAGDLAGFPGYRFGRSDEKIVAVRKALEALGETGADGNAAVAITLPPVEKTQRPLSADVILRLRESGGRTIERTLSMPVAVAIPRIGIRPGFAGTSAREDDAVAFEVVQLDAAGKAVAMKGIKWELLKVTDVWRWYSRGSDWNYEQQQVTRRIEAGTLDAAAGQPGLIAAKVGWGRYRLEVTSEETPATLSSFAFTAGYYQDETADSPEMLDVALDKATYKAGETARVRVSSRVGGKALVAVLGSGIDHMQEVDLPAGGGEIPLLVAEKFAPGAYVTVTLYRPLDGREKRMPGRAVGLKWLAVDPEARMLKVTLAAPEKVKPASTLTVPVRLAGLKPGEAARVTIAAVDVGVLNLTRFETPKPEGWFFGQRKLGLEMRDYYARLIDGMKAERGKLRSGGDGSDGGGMSTNGSPPVEATLAQFSGIVKVDPDGTANVAFELPDFNGTVRLSAVAWSGDRIGSASRDVIVRDALALTVSAPRFLTLGDEARLQLDVHNIEGPAAAYNVAVTLSPAMGSKGEAVALGAKKLDLKAGEKKADSLMLKPAAVGAYPLTIAVTGPNGIAVKREVRFEVNPPAGDIRRVTVSELKANGGRISISTDVFQDLIPGTAKATVHIGPLASLDIPGLLNQLDRYPHGCAEQTTSRALPLLYVNDIARQLGLGQDREIRVRVEKAIERVLEMQDSSGAFGIWGPADGDMWLTSYVTDFLLRAKDTGYVINARALALAVERLQNYVAYAADFEKGGEDRAYALYVLARAGRSPVGELRYYIDTRLGRFTSALAQAHLGAAMQLVGDTARAQTAFAAALQRIDPTAVDYRRDYGSGLRDGAALVTLASETRMSVAAVPRLLDVVAKAYAARPYTSTQEQAWLLLAARAVSLQAGTETLSVNGQRHTGKFVRGLGLGDLKDGPLAITNDADNQTTAVVAVMGSALTPEPAVSKGFTIERSYYTLDGKKVDLKSADGGKSTVKQNDRFVVVVKVEAKDTGGRILLADRLPAGFEIENPRLVDSGDVKALDWLKTSVKPEHTDFRDDRFVAAFNFFGTERRGRRGGDDDDSAGSTHGPVASATVAYIVRAVTPGSFVHPAATVEDMYRPDRHARTAAGRLDVTAK